MKEVYLIGCHVVNSKQENFLRRLVNHLDFYKKDFVLVSHTLLPEDIISKSVGFVYDKCNPVFWRWDLDGSPSYNFSCPNFNISSKYILYGACPYYHVGVLRLLHHGIRYLNTLTYDVIHWIEYDMFPDFDRAEENTKLINEGNQFVFHGLGSFFSFSSKNKIRDEFLKGDDKVFLELLKSNDYVAEAVIMNDLFEAEALKVFDVLRSAGDYSQNFDKIPVHWSLFQQKENEVHIFLLNKQDKEIRVKYTYNDHVGMRILLPNMYHRSHFAWLKMDGKTKVKIEVDGEIFFELEDDSQTIYDKLIKDTKVWENA